MPDVGDTEVVNLGWDESHSVLEPLLVGDRGGADDATKHTPVLRESIERTESQSDAVQSWRWRFGVVAVLTNVVLNVVGAELINRQEHTAGALDSPYFTVWANQSATSLLSLFVWIRWLFQGSGALEQLRAAGFSERRFVTVCFCLCILIKFNVLWAAASYFVGPSIFLVISQVQISRADFVGLPAIRW